METFNFYNPTKIHFGPGQLNIIGDLANKYGNSCLLVTTTRDEKVLNPLYDRTISIIRAKGIAVVHYDRAVPNPTIQSIENAIEIVKRENIKVIIGLGGGSSIDTAKAIALFYQSKKLDWQEIFNKYTSPFEEYEAPSEPVLPLITIPTTSGTGSELTQAMVLSDYDAKEKVCIFHDKIFPKEAIIDSELTKTLPKYLTAVTGFDAFSHAFESYMRKESNAYTSLIGLEAIKKIVKFLPKLIDDLENMEYRNELSLAEMFAGISLSNAAATIPHPLSEIIGGITPRISHGQALACLYKGYLEFQIGSEVEKCANVARIFDESLINTTDKISSQKLPDLVERFITSLGLESSLKKLGVSDIEFELMESHFLLTVLPFASKDELKLIMRKSY